MPGQSVTYNQVERLLEQHQQLLDTVASQTKIMATMIKQMEVNNKDWFTADEALKVLGCKVTGAGRRRLQYLRNKGFLSKFGSTKPFTYDAQQVKEVAEEVRAGRIHIPTKF